MTNFLLTDAERQRFIEYLEHEAQTSEGIIRQMEHAHMPDVVIARERAEMVAARVIAGKLRAMISETL